MQRMYTEQYAGREDGRKLTFLGATHEVTGSCYFLEACGKRILIDCGMEQGADFFVNQPIPVTAGDIDMVLLTHAHIDHSGKLPLLVKEGFAGQIFATEGTEQLCSIMLMDSAHIQESDAEWKTRKAERAGKPPVEPMYTTEDAQAAMRCFVGVPYGEEKYIADGIRIRFIDAGHLLGSASIEIWLEENGVQRKLVFSGDIGNINQPLLKDPSYPTDADYVIMESTYGDRSHEAPTDYAAALAEVLQETFDRGGSVVVPSFAVGRTQEMLYFIRHIKENHMVHGHDGFSVYVDSPLAIEATTIFQKRMYHDFDEEAMDLLARGINPIGFDGLKVSVTSEDSKMINENRDCKVILSASGMCEAGRIRHHLKHNLWRPECTILFVGYQGEGTVGRALLDGAERVKLFGEEITVKANILMLPGISGHADNEGLLRWISAVENPRKVFVTHGDDQVCQIFRDRLINELHLDAYAPYSGTCFDLAEGRFIHEAAPEVIEKSVTVEQAKAAIFGTGKKQLPGEKEDLLSAAVFKKGGKGSGRSHKASKAYQALLEACKRLLTVIEKNAGGANADLKKFAAQVDELAERWDREE